MSAVGRFWGPTGLSYSINQLVCWYPDWSQWSFVLGAGCNDCMRSGPQREVIMRLHTRIHIECTHCGKTDSLLFDGDTIKEIYTYRVRNGQTTLLYYQGIMRNVRRAEQKLQEGS